MASFYAATLLSITVVLFFIAQGARGDSSIKCYLCNTAFPSPDVSEKTCRYPEKDKKFQPTECTPSVMRDLKDGWMSESWNWQYNSYPENIKRDAPKHDWEFGWQEKPGYKLKCMQEVLHKTSKPWLQNKPDNYSQIVRFCEYRKEGENPACEKTCTSEQLTKGSCYICCSKDGCNAGNNLQPTLKILILPVIFTISAFLTRALGIHQY